MDGICNPFGGDIDQDRNGNMGPVSGYNRQCQKDNCAKRVGYVVAGPSGRRIEYMAGNDFKNVGRDNRGQANRGQCRGKMGQAIETAREVVQGSVYG